MTQEKFICGNKVAIEDEAKDGAFYLDIKIDRDCARVFFGYAKDHGVAPFEDQNGKRYDLSYDKGLYILTKN